MIESGEEPGHIIAGEDIGRLSLEQSDQKFYFIYPLMHARLYPNNDYGQRPEEIIFTTH
jgi:hypothetical protein